MNESQLHTFFVYILNTICRAGIVSVQLHEKSIDVFLPFAVLLAGCEKAEGDSEKDGSFDRVVKSVDITAKGDQESSSTLSYEFKYDSQNRLTDAIIFYNGNEQSHGQWRYSGNTVKMIDLYDDDYSIEWTINSRGLVNEQVSYYGENSEYITRYYYNNDGYLNSKIQTCNQHGIYEEFTYSREGGNVVLYTHEDSDGKATYKYTYTDYTDKANIDLMAIVGNFFIEYPCQLTEMDKSVFKSLGNKNLIKTFASEQYKSDNWSFAYEFDNDGYVTRIDLYMDKRLNGSVTVQYK